MGCFLNGFRVDFALFFCDFLGLNFCFSVAALEVNWTFAACGFEFIIWLIFTPDPCGWSWLEDAFLAMFLGF